MNSSEPSREAIHAAFRDVAAQHGEAIARHLGLVGGDNRCRTCKWWDGADAEGRCLHPKVAPLSESSSPPRDGAVCDDPFCRILTGPDFGCVHHPANGPDQRCDGVKESAE